jgi:hypothetical protein
VWSQPGEAVELEGHTVDHPERRRLKSSLVGGVVAIFSQWEPPMPALRSVVGETTQVDAQNLISDLGLAVRLGGGRLCSCGE